MPISKIYINEKHDLMMGSWTPSNFQTWGLEEINVGFNITLAWMNVRCF